jgi:hypothetical protein
MITRNHTPGISAARKTRLAGILFSADSLELYRSSSIANNAIPVVDACAASSWLRLWGFAEVRANRKSYVILPIELFNLNGIAQ